MTARTADDAADELYAAPLADFVAERKRLAAACKAAGDKAGAAALAARKKPSTSAWVVNQLHRRAADDLAALFDAGARLRRGDFAATADQRAALARLRARAGELLREAGLGAPESTLARVQQTLHALSAIGSFDPDPPGQLVGDRDPPGFETLAGVDTILPAPTAAPAAPPDDTEHLAAIARLDELAVAARADADFLATDLDRLREEVAEAERALDRARRAAADAEEAAARARRRRP